VLKKWKGRGKKGKVGVKKSVKDKYAGGEKLSF